MRSLVLSKSSVNSVMKGSADLEILVSSLIMVYFSYLRTQICEQVGPHSKFELNWRRLRERKPHFLATALVLLMRSETFIASARKSTVRSCYLKSTVATLLQPVGI